MPIAPIVQTTAGTTVIGPTPDADPMQQPVSQEPKSLADMLSEVNPMASQNPTDPNAANEREELRKQAERSQENFDRLRKQVSQRDRTINDLQAQVARLGDVVQNQPEKSDETAQAILELAKEMRQQNQQPLVSQEEINRLGADNVSTIEKLIADAIARTQTAPSDAVSPQPQSNQPQQYQPNPDDYLRAARVQAAQVYIQANDEYQRATSDPDWESYRQRQSTSLPNAMNGEILDYAMGQTGDADTIMTHVRAFLSEKQPQPQQQQMQPQQQQMGYQQPYQPQLPGAPVGNGNPQFFTPGGTGARPDPMTNPQAAPPVFSEEFLQNLKDGKIENGSQAFSQSVNQWLQQSGQPTDIPNR